MNRLRSKASQNTPNPKRTKAGPGGERADAGNLNGGNWTKCYVDLALTNYLNHIIKPAADCNDGIKS